MKIVNICTKNYRSCTNTQFSPDEKLTALIGLDIWCTLLKLSKNT